MYSFLLRTNIFLYNSRQYVIHTDIFKSKKNVSEKCVKKEKVCTHRPLLWLRTLPDDLQGRRYRGLAKVPILPWVIIVQELQQAWHVHVIIVIEMTEPSETHNKNII